MKSALILNRRSVLAAGGAFLAAPMITRSTAWAQGRSLYISTYTGPLGSYIADNVVPEFQKRTGCTVYQKQLNTLPAITALRTEKANPNTTVAMMDDVGVALAAPEGLITPLPMDSIPNLANVHDGMIYSDGHGAAFGVSRVTPWFNTQTVTDAPDSWEALWDKRFAERFIMVTPKWTNSVMLLAMCESLKSGKPVAEAQYNMLDAADKLAALKPNVISIHEDTGNAILQSMQGQADIGGPDHSKNVYPYIKQGAPIALMAPKEGAFAGVNAITLVKNAPEQELGAAFIDTILSPEVQSGLAGATYAAPSVKNATLSDDLRALMPTTPEDLAALHKLDWAFVNENRSKVIDLYNQTFG